ncbi:MAG: hypothetical protein MZV64_62945 [Ignavibacteriales bacterium]|nr:hypothetical protein [Ignavibacteriales bacterium]
MEPKWLRRNKLDQKDRKLRIEVLEGTRILRDLAANNSEIYVKYKDEFPSLYQRLWMRSESEEDKKIARSIYKRNWS